MLKLFRKYNKYILAIGASILMVAFLVQGTVSMWMPSGRDTPIGTILNGQKTITAGDREMADVQWQLLQRLGLTGYPFFNAQADSGQRALRFYLMIYEAQRLGLSASDSEVAQVEQTVGLGKTEMTQLTQAYRTQPAFVRQAIRHWLMVQALRQLALGHEFQDIGVGSSAPGLRLLALYNTRQEALRERNLGLFRTAAMMMFGAGRVSKPLAQHYIQEESSTVSGNLMVVSDDQYMHKVAKPTESQLQKLYAKYKGDLPGHSKPYGFGYRIPDRVKLDYLVIPLSVVRKHITIGEAQIMEYYNTHPKQFMTQATRPNSTQPAASQPRPKVKPYSRQIRDQIRKQLREKKARDIALRMAKTAQSLILSNIRQFGQADGYWQINQKKYHPPSMESIAAQLQQQFHIKPQVYQDRKHWVDASQIDQLPVLGQAHLGTGQNSYTAQQYVLSAKQMNPSKDNPLVARRLQVDVPSDPMSTGDAQVIFRLTAAEPSHQPHNLAEVRSQVAHDVRSLEAYHMVLAQKESLLKKVRANGLAKAAQAVGVAALPFKQVPRRQTNVYGQRLVPSLPKVGSNIDVVDAIFHTAEQTAVKYGGTRHFASLPRDQRTGSVVIPSQLSLVVYQVDHYHLITRQEFQKTMRSSGLALVVSASVRRGVQTNPLSLKSLEHRLGFQPAGEAGASSEHKKAS